MKIRGGCPFVLQGPQPEVEALHRLDRVWRLDEGIIANSVEFRNGASKDAERLLRSPFRRTRKRTRSDIHGLRKLATCREIGRNRPIVVGVVHQIGFAVPRIEHDDLLSEFAADAVERSDEVRVAADQHEGVRFVLKGVEEHFRREIDIGAFFLKPIDAEHSVLRLVAGTAFFKDRRKPLLAVLVIALDDADRRGSRKRLEVDVLPLDWLGVVRMCLNAGREVFDGVDLVVFAHQCAGELFEVEPFQLGMIPKQSVVQVATIDVYICSHVPSNAKAPTLTDRGLAPLRQNLAVRCACIIAKSAADCNRVNHGGENR